MFPFFYTLFVALVEGQWRTLSWQETYQLINANLRQLLIGIFSALGGNASFDFSTWFTNFNWVILWAGICSIIAMTMIFFGVITIIKKIFSIFFVGVR